MTINTSEQLSTDAKKIINRVVKELFSNFSSIGVWPILPLTKIGLPGDGNHIGGVFPMKRAPVQWESDAYGRVKGWQRIHIVDASVMPTLPAPTLSYSVMANAHRIASKVVATLDV